MRLHTSSSRNLLLLLVTIGSTDGFFVGPNPRSRFMGSLASSFQKDPLSKGQKDTLDPIAMQHDIQKMKQEALERLEKLTQQMEEFALEHEKHIQEQRELSQREQATNIPQQQEPNVVSQSAKKDKAGHPITFPSFAKPTVTSDDAKTMTPVSLQSNGSLSFNDKASNNNNDLLDDTRWKIVMNIGREQGTWMQKDWGASGDRLLFELVIDFTSDPSYQRDEFFQSVANVKELDVVEAWVFPTGVGQDSVGRRPIKVKDVGAYRVLQGQGPMGTDIVRMYFDLEEDVRQKASSDVYCPKGRIYATCGYFPMKKSRSDGSSLQGSVKDELGHMLRELKLQYETLEMEGQQDTRLFSMDHLKRMKDMYRIKQDIEKVSQQLQQARQREPERSQLRLSRDGRVGLSKEGGVCCKVQKGLASEYHILGRMEVASIQIEDDETEHDDYQNLVHKLHP